MEEQAKMSCTECEHFRIREKTIGDGLELWQMGAASCDVYHMEKAFHNEFELERLECIGERKE